MTDNNTVNIEQKDKPYQLESEEDIETISEENEKVLIDFSAEWCGPCQMMESTINEVAEETDILVVEVDVDEFQETAQQFEVRSVPSYIAKQNGETVGSETGVKDKDEIEDLFDQ
jgi:thioredoxin 1